MSATILIIGANFTNKGAQSMLFTVISTIRQKFPDARIIFGHNKKTSVLKDKFNFEEIYFNSNEIQFTDEGVKAKNNFGKRILEMIENVDLIIDISGFALGKKWGSSTAIKYLNNIRLAKIYDIPIILMPQSFGSFDFNDKQEEIDKMIREYMNYPVKIYAREQDGFLPLTKDYQLKNVRLHPDLVLCSQPINQNDIYKQIPKISVPQITKKSSIAVAPNIRSFDRGDPIQTLQIFYEIIKFLLNDGKQVYLLRHSIEDIVPCRWIKSLFANDDRVVLLENDFSCFEYDEICKQFEFLIVGRFHGIVHAYRNNIPCILLGWAIKYRELAQLMYQTQYIFDITTSDFDVKKIFEAIGDMEKNLDRNKKILAERLTQVKKIDTCFKDMLKIIGELNDEN